MKKQTKSPPCHYTITANQAARAVGCAPRAVQYAIERGYLRTHNDAAGVPRLDIREVEEWAEGRAFGTVGRPRLK